ASARGVSGGGGGGLRFADLDGDGRPDVPMGGTGGVATGNESPDSFVGFALRERAMKDEAEQGLKSLGYLTSGADAVDGSRQVLEGKLAYSPAPSPARTSETLARATGSAGRAVAAEAFVRRTAGKVFHLVGSVWVDSRFTEKDRERIQAIPFA